MGLTLQLKSDVEPRIGAIDRNAVAVLERHAS